MRDEFEREGGGLFRVADVHRQPGAVFTALTPGGEEGEEEEGFSGQQGSPQAIVAAIPGGNPPRSSAAVDGRAAAGLAVDEELATMMAAAAEGDEGEGVSEGEGRWAPTWHEAGWLRENPLVGVWGLRAECVNDRGAPGLVHAGCVSWRGSWSNVYVQVVNV